MIDWVQQVLLFSTVRFSSFILRHTRKRTGGVGLGWVGLGCWFITFFFIFSGTHVW